MNEWKDFSMGDIESRAVGHIHSTNGGRIYIIAPPEDADTDQAWKDMHRTIAEITIENAKDAHK